MKTGLKLIKNKRNKAPLVFSMLNSNKVPSIRLWTYFWCSCTKWNISVCSLSLRFVGPNFVPYPGMDNSIYMKSLRLILTKRFGDWGLTFVLVQRTRCFHRIFSRVKCRAWSDLMDFRRCIRLSRWWNIMKCWKLENWAHWWHGRGKAWH